MAWPLAGAATHGQASCRVSRLRPRPPVRGQLDAFKASPQGRPAAAPAGTTIYSPAPAGEAGCRAPARAYRKRPALPPAGVAALALEVAAPWQGGYRWARAAATCVGAATVAQ
ncbi:hypothetical protein GW17_00058505 [Ensete ventricosum]|nr:hypothetical protein GW17_00058505 [Ensete ventricosum]